MLVCVPLRLGWVARLYIEYTVHVYLIYSIVDGDVPNSVSNRTSSLINIVVSLSLYPRSYYILCIYPPTPITPINMHSSNEKLTSSIAYSLLLNPVAHDVILVDLKEELLEAQVRDLGDATFRGNAGVRVKKGTFEEAGQADVIVITAGAKQKKGGFSRARNMSSIC